MTERVLFVLTSHGDLGGVRPTGFYVDEAAHPWAELTRAGHSVDFVSVAGGDPPRDGIHLDDEEQRKFLADTKVHAQLRHTPRVEDARAADYRAVLFVGGHGTMWDFPHSAAAQRIGRDIHENGGVVAAVCHGPAALVNLRLSDGSHLVEGKRVTGFTNAEESSVGLTETVPFLLEDALKESGAKFLPGEAFTEHVVEDGRLITGQNPQSARALGRALVRLLAT